jgi:hypothetical protein
MRGLVAIFLGLSLAVEKAAAGPLPASLRTADPRE